MKPRKPVRWRTVAALSPGAGRLGYVVTVEDASYREYTRLKLFRSACTLPPLRDSRRINRTSSGRW